MNQDIFQGKWEEVKGKMKQVWGIFARKPLLKNLNKL